MLGKLVGIGVGPGASDLLTIRAVKKINEVDVLAIPRPNDYSKSLAFRICEPHIENRDTQEKLFLTFPMSKDKEVLRVHWEKASIEIAKRLMEGRSVGFITQGDPMIYSTFLYLMEILKETFPPLETEIVPAVTSISAVPAATQVPLCDGKEKVAVLPATYGVEELRAILQDFDSVVLMKVSSVMDQVIEALTQEDLLGHAVYVERATTHEERVVWDLTTLKGDRCVYFSMVVVNKKIRSGQLLDTRRMGAVVKEKMELEEQVLQ